MRSVASGFRSSSLGLQMLKNISQNKHFKEARFRGGGDCKNTYIMKSCVLGDRENTYILKCVVFCRSGRQIIVKCVVSEGLRPSSCILFKAFAFKKFKKEKRGTWAFPERRPKHRQQELQVLPKKGWLQMGLKQNQNGIKIISGKTEDHVNTIVVPVFDNIEGAAFGRLPKGGRRPSDA